MLTCHKIERDIRSIVYLNLILDAISTGNISQLNRSLGPPALRLLRQLRVRMPEHTADKRQILRQALTQCSRLQDLFLDRCWFSEQEVANNNI